MENGILVVEVFDRSVQSVTPCDSMEEAVSTANDLLVEHAGDSGVLIDVLAGEEEGWARATEENLNAWANWNSLEWDAHIVRF